jgi:DNA replication and repair protein RecF
MVLLYVKLHNFRNYQEEEITFHPGTNILFGQNGQGKTNILEGLYYLALTKSFRTNNDQNIVLARENYFRVQGDFVTEQGKKISATIAYSLSDGKRLNFNRQRVSRFADYIGNIPVVLLAPSDLEISQGGPHKRRQFLDIMLSQSSKLYLHHLLQYRQSLKQRNALLQKVQLERNELLPWEESLVKNGTIVIKRRLEAVEKLDKMVKQFYQQMSGEGEKVKLVYQTSFPMKESEDMTNAFQTALQKNLERDIELQSTSVGPHRDDLIFLIKGQPLRWRGSQGEHKTFIISLKMAEYDYLQSVQNDSPILLFDDIFGELDSSRITNMVNSLKKIGQVFITTTSPNFFNKVKQWEGETHFYEVKLGKVTVHESS